MNYTLDKALEAFVAILSSPAAPALALGAMLAGLACEALHWRGVQARR